MRVFEGSHLEFDITDIPQTLDYDIVVRYEPQVISCKHLYLFSDLCLLHNCKIYSLLN